MLEQEHRLRVEQVQFALAAPLVLAADLEAPVRPLGLVERVGLAVPGGDLVVDLAVSPMPPIRLEVPVK